MLCLTLAYPLTVEDRAAAVAALDAGAPVQIGGCYLSPDDDNGLIWGTDPYGCDGVASTPRDATDALAWVDYQENRPLGDHPAERQMPQRRHNPLIGDRHASPW